MSSCHKQSPNVGSVLVATILGLVLGAFDLFAQHDSISLQRPVKTSERRAKAIYLEVLGRSGFGLSLLYDMRFRKGHDGLGINLGISQPKIEPRATTYSFPIFINHVSSERRVALEVGGGLIVAYRRWWSEDQTQTIHRYHQVSVPAMANVGIRIQPINTGVVCRLFWAPNWRIGREANLNGRLLWFGASLGIGFN